jgi:peptide chain release factor 2
LLNSNSGFRLQRSSFDIESVKARAAELEEKAAAPDLWEDPEAAKRTLRELSSAKDTLEHFESLRRQLEDAQTLYKLGQEEHDLESLEEVADSLDALTKEFERLELETLFTEPLDERDAILSIHPGAGGTDSADWADMLLRMYLRWAETQGLSAEVNDYQEGEEAGLKSATVTIRGPYAYGKLEGERGVHRLVRISPFDASARRHTSFAAVDVIPVVDRDDEVEIDEEDLKIETFRSSGHGGQHVNVTDSAVRITHLPTGIVVSCQNERSQIQNRAKAMEILKARLAELKRRQHEEEMARIRGEQKQVAFGSQIRSYVLHPYQQVKDLRTGYETSSVNDVLDGDLEPFIESYLRWRRAGSARSSAEGSG